MHMYIIYLYNWGFENNFVLTTYVLTDLSYGNTAFPNKYLMVLMYICHQTLTTFLDVSPFKIDSNYGFSKAFCCFVPWQLLFLLKEQLMIVTVKHKLNATSMSLCQMTIVSLQVLLLYISIHMWKLLFPWMSQLVMVRTTIFLLNTVWMWC